MRPEEIEAIAATVKADRKRVLPPLTDPLPLRFGRPRFITDPALLSEAERLQMVAVGIDGVGLALSPEELLEVGPDEGFYEPETWDVLDATGALAYRVWIYGTDNGTICRGDSLEIVAGMSQGGAAVSRPTSKGPGGGEALIDALIDAARRVPEAERPKGSCLRFFGR